MVVYGSLDALNSGKGFPQVFKDVTINIFIPDSYLILKTINGGEQVIIRVKRNLEQVPKIKVTTHMGSSLKGLQTLGQTLASEVTTRGQWSDLVLGSWVTNALGNFFYPQGIGYTSVKSFKNKLGPVTMFLVSPSVFLSSKT